MSAKSILRWDGLQPLIPWGRLPACQSGHCGCDGGRLEACPTDLEEACPTDLEEACPTGLRADSQDPHPPGQDCHAGV